ncbi:heptahelical transmembrane protein 4-like [Canna indica]|uniref:Heptahelical transmembrane protein 4-like n=1 Tax=Canna indica TaxID=4628 RepID=A0AAQ3K8W2_9LILI|nr:heptahelical transmembrane protein 4-like [Canna indica]
MVVANLTISSVTLEKTSFAENDEGQFLLSPVTEVMKKQQQQQKKKKSSCCSKEKCKLVDYNSLPNFLKHNEFILNYYRSEWPMRDAVFSIFSIHNETINIWTHLIGFFVFLTITFGAVMMVPIGSSSVAFPDMSPAAANISKTLEFYNHEVLLHGLASSSPEANLTGVATDTGVAAQATARWPFYSYLFGAMFCLLMSSACHLLSCHSEHTSYVMLRLDYAGITTLIVTSFYPLVYYSFLCEPYFQYLYLSFITVFGVAAVLVSLVPVFETPEFRIVRAGLFACMALSGLVPIVHKMIAYGQQPEAVLTTGYEAAMGVFYGLGVIVYATRIPERWMPGKFDLAGHSHQLFHVLVIAGAYSHYLAGLVYLRWRDMEACY